MAKKASTKHGETQTQRKDVQQKATSQESTNMEESSLQPTVQAKTEGISVATSNGSVETGKTVAVSTVPKETRDAKFYRLAKRRVSKALWSIGQVGLLSNRGQYEYTDDQIEKVFAALEEAIANIKGKFCGTAKSNNSFTF